jgi:hypothetical protein
MNCPKLVCGKIKMCDSEMFDGMVPNLSELRRFCESGEYHLCPFFIGSKNLVEREKIAHSVSDWNVFHRELVGT